LINPLFGDRFFGIGLQLVKRNVGPRAHLAARLRIIALCTKRGNQANGGRQSQHRLFHANLPTFVMLRSLLRFFEVASVPYVKLDSIFSIKRLPFADKLTLASLATAAFAEITTAG
jgi:hypothetical protein